MGILNVTLGSINSTTNGVQDGYQDYSCATGTILSPGVRYPISITTNTNADENVRVWVDFDNNGTFDPVNELFFSSNNARLHTGTTAVVPATAVLNQPLRLRIAADYANVTVPTPCSTPQYSQVEDYRVTVQPNTLPPVAAFAVGSAQACAGTFAFQDQSQQGPTSWRWRFGDGSVSTQSSPTHTYTAPGTYTVTLRVCNGNGCDSLTRQAAVTVYTTNPSAPTCRPTTTTYCCGYGITRAQLGLLTSSSADASAGYEDFACTRRFDAVQGQLVPVRLETSTSRQDTWIYLDANDDGDFSPAEKVFTALGRLNPEGFIIIPRTTLLNRPLRLRIISDDVNTSDNPCATRTRGQVEDYAVIVAPAPCPATLRGGQANGFYSESLLSPSRIHHGVLLTGYSQGATVQWQRSRDLTTPVWQNIPGATSPNLYFLHSNLSSPDSIYRAVVSCGGNQATSTIYYANGVPIAQLQRNVCGTNYIARVAIASTTLDNVSTCSGAQGNAYAFHNPNNPGQTATLLVGRSYQVSVTTTQSCRVALFLWDNLPRQLVPPLVQNATAGVSTTFTLNLDTVAYGNLRGVRAAQLRIRCEQVTGTPTPIVNSTATNGETEDYLVRLLPRACTELQVEAGTVTAAAPAVCPRSTVALQAAGFSPDARLQWQSSPDSLTWTDAANQTNTTFTAVVNAPTYYRVRAAGCATVAYSPPVKVTLRPPTECYCPPPAGTTTGLPVITRVRLVGTPLDNSSSPSDGPQLVSYAPTTPSRTATVVRGATYALELDVQLPVGAPQVTAAAWLDLNRNALYDSLEWIHLQRTGPAAAGVTTLRAELPISTLAALGATGLRLRVAAGPEVLRPRHACNALGTRAGEAEEYTLTVVDAPCASAGALTAGTVEWPTPVNCLKLLRSRNYTIGTELQWQRSADQGANWSDIAGATGEVTQLPPAQVSSGAPRAQYRLRVRCGGQTAYSAPVTDGGPLDCVVECFNQRTDGNLPMFMSAYIDRVSVAGTPLANLDSGPNYIGVPSGGGYPHTRADPQAPHLTATLVRGQSYTLNATLTLTYLTPPADRRGGVWVDWNHDGLLPFAERCASFGPVQNSGPVAETATLSVPATAVLGPTLLRVRVWQNLSTSPAALLTDGCSYTNGASETEDYVVTIVDQAGPTLPTLTASPLNPQGGPLTLTSSSAGAGATYAWLGPNGFAASGATASLASAANGLYVLTAVRNGQRITTSLQVPVDLTTPTRPLRLTAPLSVYPNPTTGLCALRLPAGLRPDRLLLRTATGRLLTDQPATAHPAGNALEVPLDLRGQPRGLYFVELRTAQGSTFAKVLLE